MDKLGPDYQYNLAEAQKILAECIVKKEKVDDDEQNKIDSKETGFSFENFASKITNEFTGDKWDKKMKSLEEITNENFTRNKLLWVAISTGFSSLASIIVLDSFVGHLWLNLIIAIGVGFGIYRVQDFQKVIKKG